MLYLAVGVRDSRNSSDDMSDRIKAQELDNHAGKVLRLTDEGRAPQDNPFVGKAGVKPEIYNSNLVSDQPWWRPGVEMPVMFWAPAISPSSILIYSGTRFPMWKGHVFIGALSGQQVQRVAFNQPGPQTERRESMLVPLDVRVRDVRQAPDGSICVAVERDTQLGPGSTKLTPTGSVLRIAPAE